MSIFKRRVQSEVIDLRDSASGSKRVSFEFGFPTRCPVCGERGYLDHIDPFDRIQYEHCPVCAAKWEQSEADIVLHNSITA